MEKLETPQIIGSMSASLTIVQINLSSIIKTYGENIPAKVIQELLKEVTERVERHNEQWENRA